MMRRTIQLVLTFFIGIGAVIGACMMWIDPAGESWGGAALLDMFRSKMPWPDVFFNNFIPSGFVLLIVNGLTQLTAGCLLLKRHRLAPLAVLTCGIILIAWIVLEWWIFGFNALSNIYFLLGLIEIFAAAWNCEKKNV